MHRASDWFKWRIGAEHPALRSSNACSCYPISVTVFLNLIRGTPWLLLGAAMLRNLNGVDLHVGTDNWQERGVKDMSLTTDERIVQNIKILP